MKRDMTVQTELGLRSSDIFPKKDHTWVRWGEKMDLCCLDCHKKSDMAHIMTIKQQLVFEPLQRERYYFKIKGQNATF